MNAKVASILAGAIIVAAALVSYSRPSPAAVPPADNDLPRKLKETEAKLEKLTELERRLQQLENRPKVSEHVYGLDRDTRTWFANYFADSLRSLTSGLGKLGEEGVVRVGRYQVVEKNEKGVVLLDTVKGQLMSKPLPDK